jgi:hypothetical protein
VHRPGEAMQTDFTWANTLGITIGGEAFPHLLCHPVLPYSNWEWATICHSESMAALRHGVQAALGQLGRAPTYHQTDNSTAATHDLRTGKRGFNAEYEALVAHYGMVPRTIEVGEKEQNGDVESLNGVLKRRLTQQLLLRGSREFETVAGYEGWVHACLEAANRLRAPRLAEELAVMRALPAARLPEFVEHDVRVTAWSTIRVKHNAYSVPSRLAGEVVRVRIFEERLEVCCGGAPQLTVARLPGRNGHRITWTSCLRAWQPEQDTPRCPMRSAFQALTLCDTFRRGAGNRRTRIVRPVRRSSPRSARARCCPSSPASS